jgi:hypothetical protein
VNSTYWDSRETSIQYTPGGTRHVAIELTLRARPGIKLVMYELADGIHIAQGPWRYDGRSTVIPAGDPPNTKNQGFVEAMVNEDLQARLQTDSSVTFDWAKAQGARFARKGKLSPETIELFMRHVTAGMLAQTKRREKVRLMKGIVKQLGDMTEDEMLEIWRESRAEEVMDS